MKARRSTDGTGDVFDPSALDALQMMMIVVGMLHFVECARSIGKTHSSNNASAGEIAQDGVDGGESNAAERDAQPRMHGLCRCMRAGKQGIENGHTLHRYAQPGTAQALRRFQCDGRAHVFHYAIVLNHSQKGIIQNNSD